jgi:hypothetical protein
VSTVDRREEAQSAEVMIRSTAEEKEDRCNRMEEPAYVSMVV